MGAGGTGSCDCWAAVPAVSAPVGGRVPVSVPSEGLHSQAETGDGGSLL